jgi:hypothetical protein
MDVANLFESKAKQLFWAPIDPSHLSGVPAPQAIPTGQAYFTIRLCEMYLAFARKLWTQIYPMVHCLTQFGAASDHAVVSPTQFAPLGEVNLDRLVNVDMLLSGPHPYNGGDVELIVGLYAVPGSDSATALIDVVGSFAALNPGVVAATIAFATLIENAVVSILQLNKVTLHLGVRDTFHEGSNPLASGYFAGIAADSSEVDPTQLWVVQDRLRKGPDAASSAEYTDHDYMLISIERTDTRDEWTQLPELQESQAKISNVIADTVFTVVEKQDRLAALWPVFVQALTDSPSLTDPDRQSIATEVAADLLNRLKLQEEGNPFLRKAS